MSSKRTRAADWVIGVVFAAGMAALPALAPWVGVPTAFAQSARRGPVTGVRPLVEREVTVANRSRKPATELYVSVADAPDWGDEWLGGTSVPPGQSFRARLGRTRACLFDVQLVYADGSREELHGFDVCRASQVAFDGSAAIDIPVGPSRQVTLVNNSTRPIQQVFLSEAEAARWGDDRVTGRGLSVGARLEIPFRGVCAVDLRVIYDNRAAEERRGLDICATPALSIEPGWTTADAPPVPSRPALEPALAAPVPPAPATSSAPPPSDAAPTALRVLNSTGADVTELYLYPEGQADHGQDLLGNAVLRDGGAKPVLLARRGVCRFSAHLVFAGRVADRELRGLDLCAGADLVLKR